MSAFHVVVRPSPHRAPSPALGSLYGLFDVVVDGVNITARIGDGVALSLLADLAQAVASLATGRRQRTTLSLYSNDDVWELGLEADGDDVLVTVYRPGALPEVAVHERRVALAALRDGVLAATSEAPLDPATARTVVHALAAGQRALTAAWPPRPLRPRSLRHLRIAPQRRGDICFIAEADLRCPAPSTGALDTSVERADLHALLACGKITLHARDREAALASTHLFLVAERLVALADDGLDAWQGARPVFRRIDFGGASIGIRRGPGEGPLDVSVSSPSMKPGAQRVTFPAIGAPDFARAALGFARELCTAFESTDPSQKTNLRLKGLRAAADALEERVEEAVRDDSITNPEPDSYRFYAPRPQRSPASRGSWGHGAKIRFAPKWVATVPNVDLRATFVCGERIVVGAARETACIDRNSGAVVWRTNTGRGGSVITPCGLVRLEPDGRIVLHDLDSGETRFTARLMPRSAGGATGAVVHTPGLPKLLVVAEGDRHIAAIDLVSGDVRWRYTGRRPCAYRIRRAGKLLLVTGGDSALLALDVASGDLVWRVRDRLPFSHAVTLDHDGAFVLSGSTAGTWKLHHVDPWTGEVLYSIALDDPPLPNQPPVVTADVVVVPTRDRSGVGARGFARKDGSTLWEIAPGFSSPLTAWLPVDDFIIANSDAGVLSCIDAHTGVLRYSHVFSRGADADQPRRLEPILRSGALFVPQHEVHVVRPHDGDVIGTVPCDLIPDLLRVDECCNVYIAEESGHIAAFGAAPRLTLVK